jgi:hypothetical protein
VKDRETEEPVGTFRVSVSGDAADASMALPSWPAPGREFTDGTFQSDVPFFAEGASYRIRVVADGYLPFELENYRPSPESHCLRIALESARTVVGTITADEGEMPIAGAEVRFEADRLVRSARSDGAGRFRLTGLPLGTSTLTVTHDAHLPFEAAVVFEEADARLELPVSLRVSGSVDLQPTGLPRFGPGCTVAFHVLNAPTGYPESLVHRTIAVGSSGTVSVESVPPDATLDVTLVDPVAPDPVATPRIPPSGQRHRTIPLPAAYASGQIEVELIGSREGRPPVRVTLTPPEGTQRILTLPAGEDARVVSGLAPGDWRVAAASVTARPDLAPRPHTVRVESGKRTTVRITLQ